MLIASQLRDLIIKPALLDLIMFSEEALELLMFTCAVESNGGTYIKQLNGPALGIFQMEPATYNDIWQNYLIYKSDILLRLLHSFSAHRMPEEDRLMYDLRFATAMTRIHYFRVNAALPAVGDIDGIWDYYKTHYNTALGAADKTGAIERYKAFIA